MVLSLMLLMGFVTVIALPSVIWLYALADVIRNDFRNVATKFVWALVLCFFPPLGTLLYFLVGRSQRITAYPVGRLVLFCIFMVPAMMIVAYLLYAFGHLAFMPEPPRAIQI